MTNLKVNVMKSSHSEVESQVHKICDDIKFVISQFQFLSPQFPTNAASSEPKTVKEEANVLEIVSEKNKKSEIVDQMVLFWGLFRACFCT